MMKTVQKTVSLLLLIILTLSSFPLSASAATGVTYREAGLPVVSFKGSLEGISKENKVTVDVDYSSKEQSFSCKATLKVQGASSAVYPKKNFTIQFMKEDGKTKNKVTLVDSWGKESKYCLKANYIDRSQARNIVAAKLFGQVVHSRMKDDELEPLVNGGAIDGYPVAVYLNGAFYGLYTMNIPKDNWLFGMKDETVKQALLFGDTWTDSVGLKEEIAADPAESGWEIEYCSTEDDPEVGTKWVTKSFNQFIRFLNNNDGKAFRAGIGKYTDIERAIDVYIFTYYIFGTDNTGKNMLWASFDGTKWIPSMYDMDSTFGLSWNGNFDFKTPKVFAFGKHNLLFERLADNYADEIKARYIELREDILSMHNLKKTFSDFIGSIPASLYTADDAKWKEMPGKGKNNYTQIVEFTGEHVAFMDKTLGVTVTEKEPLSYKTMFSTDGNADVYVCSGPLPQTAPKKALSAFSLQPDTYALTKDGGKITFTLSPKAGKKISEVTVLPATGYDQLLGPEETGFADTYAVTGIRSGLTVTVAADEREKPAKGYEVRFSCPEDAEILVYPRADGRLSPVKKDIAFSVSPSDGTPAEDGSGQVDFTTAAPEGYMIDTVTAYPAFHYAKLKHSSDADAADCYSLTGVTGDITVTVTVRSKPQDKPTMIPGDVDNNGVVDAEDSRMALRASVGLEHFSSGTTAFTAADFDGSGTVTPADARLILRLAVGL